MCDYLRMCPWWSLCTLYSSHARWSYHQTERTSILSILVFTQKQRTPLSSSRNNEHPYCRNEAADALITITKQRAPSIITIMNGTISTGKLKLIGCLGILIRILRPAYKLPSARLPADWFRELDLFSRHTNCRRPVFPQTGSESCPVCMKQFIRV